MALPAPIPDYNFPKAELHCHLDGTYELKTMIEMAKERGVPLPSYSQIMLSRKLCTLRRCEDLDEYLEIFKVLGPAFTGNLKNIERLAKETVLIKARYGIRYVELRYSPHLMLDDDSEKNGITVRDVVHTVNEAIKKGMEEVKSTCNKEIVVRTILCSIITFPIEISMETAQLCKEFAHEGVVGFDIAGAGDKMGKMILKHQKAYQFCKDNNIGRTAHAGEKGSSHEVKVAIEQLFCQRIGHGYKVVDDEELYQDCIKKGIHFEVCPLSSYLTASVSTDMSLHPAIRFMKDGVAFSLNTDDPGPQQTCIDDEYEISQNMFQFTFQQMHQTNINALKAAFVDDETKQRLLAEFQLEYDNWVLVTKTQNGSRCTAF